MTNAMTGTLNTFQAINPFSGILKSSQPDSWNSTKSESGTDRTNFDTGNRSYIDLDIIDLILEYYLQSKSPVSTQHASDFTTTSSKITPDKFLEIAKNILRHLQLGDVDKQLEELSNVLDNSEVKAPNQTTLANAKEILYALYDQIESEGLEWIPPLIHGDELRYVLIVWRANRKALHFDICEDDMEAVKSWKENSKQKLKPFPLTIDNCFAFWKWWIS